MLLTKLVTSAINTTRVYNFKQTLVLSNRFAYFSFKSFTRMSSTVTPASATTPDIHKSSVISKVYENIVKPSTDSRTYRGLELHNGMKCLLISDPKTDKSAAAVDVNIGYLMDPIPGLAHFCEHMLFLGSTKVFLLFLKTNP